MPWSHCHILSSEHHETMWTVANYAPLDTFAPPAKMPAINNALISREAISHIAKRENWAQKEAGVIVVFAIVFIVAVGVIGLFVGRKISAARARKQSA